MPRTSKRKRVVSKNSTVQNPTAQTLPRANLNKPQTEIKSFEPYEHLKNDLKWSGITAGIIAIILIIVYIFLH
jgi:uncharacterized integral membrane protein